MRPRLVRHLVAIFVLLHGVSVVVSSLPGVKGHLSSRLWQEEAVQHEVRQWLRAFAAVGVELTSDELQRHVFDVGFAYSRVRDTLVAPFAPYHKYLGTGQSWNLFTSAHRVPSRLEIDVEERGAFRPLYVARSRVHDWHAAQLDDVRLRKAVYLLSWKRSSSTFTTFSEWVAREVARERPEATRVRVRYWRYETPSPEMVRRGEAPKGRYVSPRVYELEAYR